MKKRYVVIPLAIASLAAGGEMALGAREQGALFAVMTGKKEVSPAGRKGVGDRNGRGSFSATLKGRELCYGIQVKNIADPTAAHIHRGSPRVAGPIVQPLDPPSAGDPGQSGDCITLSASLARGIGKNPAKFYVNVHTADFPGGAVRGQLFAKTR